MLTADGNRVVSSCIWYYVFARVYPLSLDLRPQHCSSLLFLLAIINILRWMMAMPFGLDLITSQRLKLAVSKLLRSSD